MCHGYVLLPLITIYVPNYLPPFQNMLENREVSIMELISLIVTVIQLVIDIAACVGSSPTVRLYIANIAQLVEHMAESIFNLQTKKSTDKKLLLTFSIQFNV